MKNIFTWVCIWCKSNKLGLSLLLAVMVAVLPVMVLGATTAVPTVTAQATSAITLTTCTLNGDITDLGGAVSCDLRGFVWDTVSHTVPSASTAPAASEYDFYYVYSVGGYPTGAFTHGATVTNTKYYARAFAHNDFTGGYGWSDEINWVMLPTVTTMTGSNLAPNTLTLRGNVISTGGEDNNTQGFVWGNDSNKTPAPASTVAPGSAGYDSNFISTPTPAAGTGVFTKAITPTPGVDYYYRAFSHNTSGYTYGELTQVNVPTYVGFGVFLLILPLLLLVGLMVGGGIIGWQGRKKGSAMQIVLGLVLIVVAIIMFPIVLSLIGNLVDMAG